ncbi:hypothetical protein SBOR_1092 [Sclerotinia borealis F-4128]|uniref:Heterokaryon incompatibility domain-containing protein n=1 Tax=Sclerotinia borealis (strain F-4128) TaxID=1432307 RepID=W9CV83_SCLBF|nr:hypothetical protein SBOR_1092 [Sclerotinia borealis F-4128]
MSGCAVCFDLDPRSESGKLNWKRHITDNLKYEYRLHFDADQIDNAARAGCPNCSVLRSGLRLIQNHYLPVKRIMDVERTGKLIIRKGCPLQLELKNFLRFDYFSKTEPQQEHKPQNPGQAAFGIAKDVSPNISIGNTQSFPIVDGYQSTDWNIHVRPSFEPIHHRYNKSFGSEPDPLDKEVTPLLCRAWVFQERQLAPRTLHFHPSELVMECKTGLRCECTVLDRAQKASTKFAKTPDSTNLEKYGTFAQWYELVREYSQLSITHQSDRLIALIGVATQFQEKVKCGSLAGLWDLDIAKGLMWNITGYDYMRGKMNIKRVRKPFTFAPSWSWASVVPGPESPAPSISFPLDQTLTPHDKFKFLGTDIPRLASGWHMTLGTGHIRVNVLAVPAIIYNERRGPSRSIKTQLLFESKSYQQYHFNPNRRYRVNLDVTQTAVPSKYYGTMSGVAIYCLIIATRIQSHQKLNTKAAWLYVLLCKQCGNESQEVECERVGVFHILKDDMPLECSKEMTVKLV